jgi:hypothetical protein
MENASIRVNLLSALGSLDMLKAELNRCNIPEYRRRNLRKIIRSIERSTTDALDQHEKEIGWTASSTS